MKLAPVCVGAALLLGACSTDDSSDKVAGGGFETSDLSAVLVDSSGNPVVGARVWLLSENTDSLAPAKAIDSATTDSLGVATFKITQHQSPLGLEAWLGDTLSGIRSAIDPDSISTISLRMARTKAFTLPCLDFDSSVFILPQSHFSQNPPRSCQDSVRILVPPGTWTLFSMPESMDKPPRSYHVGDSLPPWRPPPRDSEPGQFGPWPPPDSSSH